MLTIHASFDTVVPGGFDITHGGEAFVDGISDWNFVCKALPCKFDYKFRLAKAAQALDDPEVIGVADGVYMTTPSAWLVRPKDWNGDETSDLHVSATAPTVFVTGLPLGKDGTYFFRSEFADDLSPAFFGPARVKTLRIGGARIDVALSPVKFELKDPEILAWVKRAADAVTAYFGRFPVEHAMIYLRPRAGDGRGSGMTLGFGGAAIFVPLALKATTKDLARDWVMTHEMVHLAMPNVRWNHHWLEEGLATYVEPLARIRSKEMKAEHVWSDILVGIPQGLPEAGDRGLDNTRTWGRTYWGGALFFLLADVEIRTQTKGRLGLEDALKGVLKVGGSIEERWDVDDVLARADKAVGLKVLAPLYARMKDAPAAEDLALLWQKLGVSRQGDEAHFDDKAPLAYVRQGISFGGAFPAK